MQTTSKFKGIIFDFNGVLLWDSAWHDQAWDKISKELRGYPLTKEEMEERVYGRTNRDIIAYVTGRAVPQRELVRLIERKESAYRSIALSQGPDFSLSPGAEQLLEYLVSNKVPHTIATATGISDFTFFIHHLALQRWFVLKDIVCDDGTLPGKPDPTIYQLAAQKINLTPGQCLVVEDARSGIEAARRAGVGKIIALGPADTHADLFQIDGVSQVITNLNEIDISEFES